MSDTITLMREGSVKKGDLINEVNNSIEMQATCTQIINDGAYYQFKFNQDITAEETTAITDILANHVPTEEVVDFTELPYSTLGEKLAVHSSSMPNIDGKVFYDVWAGAGDDIVSGESGDGELLELVMSEGVSEVDKCAEFSSEYGDLYIHGGYIKFEGGGSGDYLTADIVAKGTVMQPVQDLIATIDEDGWVVPVITDPTHGFGGAPTLISRAYSGDGNWDYSPDTGLLPNFESTGGYKINTNDIQVHRYINRIPCLGTINSFLEIESAEAAYIPPGYFICARAHNNSNTSWHATVIVNVYRERSIKP